MTYLRNKKEPSIAPLFASGNSIVKIARQPSVFFFIVDHLNNSYAKIIRRSVNTNHRLISSFSGTASNHFDFVPVFPSRFTLHVVKKEYVERLPLNDSCRNVPNLHFMANKNNHVNSYMIRIYDYYFFFLNKP